MRDVLKEQGAVTVTCDFCSRPYEYDAAAVDALFAAEGGNARAARDLAVTLNATDGAAVAATYISESLQCSERPEPRRLPPSGS